MNLFTRAALGVACHLSLLAPACAQWQGEAGLGARAVSHTEYDGAGRRLVSERGLLPGIALGVAFKTGKLTWSGAADWYRDDIDYRGHTQAGVRATSTTSTGLASLRIGAAYAIGRDYSAMAAVEADLWRRDIRSSGASVGLQERYRSERLVLGAGKAWHPAFGMVAADVAAVFSTPERMRVGFSGLLDPASLETRRGRGLRMGVRVRPAFAPALELRGMVDWIGIARSADAPVTRNGQFAGTMAQPKHERQALSLMVATLF